MRDAAADPVTIRLHALVSRLSREGGYVVAQADVAEGVARIVQLEHALERLLGHIDGAEYRDAAGRRLGDGTAAVAAARAALRPLPP